RPKTWAARATQFVPIRIHRTRLPHIRAGSEIRGENTDDPGRSAFQLNTRADRIERASEAGLPEAMTDQRQALPLLSLLSRKDAPMQGPNAKQWEQVSRSPEDTNLFRPIRGRQRRRNAIEECHIREALA